MLTAAQIRQEVRDRGFHHLGDRVDLFVDQAALEVHLKERWPFRLDETTGALPITIAKGAVVKHVRRTSDGRALKPVPESSYRDAESRIVGDYYVILKGVQIAATDGTTPNVTVTLWDALPWTVGGERPDDESDTLVMPPNYESLVIELAVAKACDDDGRDTGPAIRTEQDTRFEEMRDDLLRPGDEPSYVTPESIY